MQSICSPYLSTELNKLSLPDIVSLFCGVKTGYSERQDTHLTKYMNCDTEIDRIISEEM
jgi:hypothetical protein